MNVAKLEKLKKRILTSARAQFRFNMNYWGESTKKFNGAMIDQIVKNPPCHTQACFAGETLLMERRCMINKEDGGLITKDGFVPHFMDEASEILGLSVLETDRLFKFKRHGARYGWPQHFVDDYYSAKTPLERAKVAAARIDHFIKTNGEE